MSTWFMQRRQEFIGACLRQFGQVRREQLVREFAITKAVASQDIATFTAANPTQVTYDVSAKCFVAVDAAPAPPAESEAMTILRLLADAEEAYRKAYLIGGETSAETGLAWDQMCRTGYRARAFLHGNQPLYLVCKQGLYYRPNAKGYTSDKAEAGRYTFADATRLSHPNGPDGPRDGMSIEPASGEAE